MRQNSRSSWCARRRGPTKQAQLHEHDEGAPECTEYVGLALGEEQHHAVVDAEGESAAGDGGCKVCLHREHRQSVRVDRGKVGVKALELLPEGEDVRDGINTGAMGRRGLVVARRLLDRAIAGVEGVARLREGEGGGEGVGVPDLPKALVTAVLLLVLLCDAWGAGFRGAQDRSKDRSQDRAQGCSGMHLLCKVHSGVNRRGSGASHRCHQRPWPE